ncbi:3986_t:CDS:2, partial [Funneliformis caledonium]
SRLCVRMQFDHWNHANLVLLAYGQQTGFVWRIQDKYLDKNGGVYKQSVKIECTCFINMCWPLKSPGPSITKMNLAYYGHTLNSETIKFANIYRQFPQNIIEFNADMSSTQRVESINAIVHKYVILIHHYWNALMVYKICSSLNFKKQNIGITCDLPFSIASFSAVRVFSKLVESFKEFLTDEVFHIQKAQIDIDEFDTSACIEDSIDKSQVALKSLINHVNITNILEILKVKHMATNTSSTNYVALLMLRIQTAKFAITLIKNQWYKKDINIQNINTIYDLLGIYHQETNTATENSALNSIYKIQNLRQDSLGRKLTTLAAEFNLTHVSATMWGLIEQVEQIEQLNINSTSDNRSQEIVQNLSQASAKGKPAKRLKSCVENNSKKSNSKQINTNVCFGDAYICQNCSANGHNARSYTTLCKIYKENGHTYLHCQNKENV